ncbi:MAG: hypothetical protein NWE78_06400 [Candidatus Bathyarchaeota archaeon]|nr:hypothetical protein [Candidatus Bathyarchaeota archaeon]
MFNTCSQNSADTNVEDITDNIKETPGEGFYTFIPHCLMERPDIWSGDKYKQLEKSQFAGEFGDVDYGVGSVSA